MGDSPSSSGTFLLIAKQTGPEISEQTERVVRTAESRDEFDDRSDASWNGLARKILWPFAGVILEGEEGASRELVISNGSLPPIVAEIMIQRLGERASPRGGCAVWGVSLEGRRSLPDPEEAETGISEIEITGGGRALTCSGSEVPLASEMTFTRKLVSVPWAKSEGAWGRIEVAWSEIP